jgi:hypothetical protein
VGACAPLAKSRGGGGGERAWGGRGSIRHQAVDGTDARHGGAYSGDAGRRHGIRRALEEEEARLLHLEVSGCLSRCLGFEGLALKLLSSCQQGGADHATSRARQGA